jgi:hypothetical protein
MKYTTGTTLKLLATITVIMATSTIASSGLAADEGRKMVDPGNEPVSKVVVQITQLPGISKGAGNGVIVGADACHVLTNFHVAYGKDNNPKGGMILVDDQEVGHVVEVGVDLDPKTGTFRRKIKARVIEFGNFEEGTSQGMRGDLAMLKLDECLGKSYGLVKVEKPEPGQVAPDGALTVFGFSKIAENKSGLFAEKACGAVEVTPIAGLFISTCKIVPGASGSPVLKQDKNGEWLLVGMQTGELTLKSGKMIAYALHSSTLAKFVEGVIGSEPIRMGLASVASTNDTVTAQSSSGKTVVR